VEIDIVRPMPGQEITVVDPNFAKKAKVLVTEVAE
jgi:hypothetical protein